ncbi:MAG TPA: TolC family protein, partial [Chitinophagales bacterium]|nr:TolC family protein [Chitinophagales bacterium]
IHIPVSIGATKAQIKSLEYQKQATQAIATYQQTNLLNQYNNAVTQQEQQLQEYMYLKNKAIPNANEMIQVAQAGYRSGDINYIEYLMALQNAGDVHLNYLKKILQLNESIIFINTILQP